MVLFNVVQTKNIKSVYRKLLPNTFDYISEEYSLLYRICMKINALESPEFKIENPVDVQ
jgi:hypothetical protein